MIDHRLKNLILFSNLFANAMNCSLEMKQFYVFASTYYNTKDMKADD